MRRLVLRRCSAGRDISALRRPLLTCEEEAQHYTAGKEYDGSNAEGEIVRLRDRFEKDKSEKNKHQHKADNSVDGNKPRIDHGVSWFDVNPVSADPLRSCGPPAGEPAFTTRQR